MNKIFNIFFVVTNILKDFILDLNKKTNFQKHKQNATKILYPLYITIVYGLSESHFDTTLIVPFVRTLRFVVLFKW